MLIYSEMSFATKGLLFQQWVNRIILVDHEVSYLEKSKQHPLTKFDVNRIHGLAYAMLQEIGTLRLQKKVCCKVVLPGVKSLESFLDMCDQKK